MNSKDTTIYIKQVENILFTGIPEGFYQFARAEGFVGNYILTPSGGDSFQGLEVDSLEVDLEGVLTLFYSGGHWTIHMNQ